MTVIVLARRASIYHPGTDFHDLVLEAGAIPINQNAYTAALDRVFNTKGLKNMHIEIENNGANGLTYKIEKARKEFTDDGSSLNSDDFDIDVKANTNVAPGSQATGTVDVTGGPSVKADGTLTCVSAVALTKATGTITCATVLENTFATGTATLLAVTVGDTVTINGLVYTAISGSKAGDFTKFDIDGTDTADAADLADSINNDVRSGTTGDVSATSSVGVVTITTDVLGTAGDAITLAETGTTITISGATFSGGVNADTVTVNGLVYTAVAGARANDTEFSTDTGDNETALDLAAAITADVRSGTLNDVTATSSTNVVTCTQSVGGTGGNATTLTSTDGVTLAVSGATFTGGLEADTATVNGLVYTAVAGAKANDTQFSIDTGDNETATDLADSIDDDVRPPVTVPTIDVTATATTNVVTVSAPINDGAAGNAIDLVASANITADNATLTGGVSSSMDGITVDLVEIMSGVEPFDTDTDTTAINVAANITAFTSSPNYNASASSGLITITKVNQGPSTDTVVSTTTVLTTTDVNMSGGVAGKSIEDIVDISPEATAIRIRVKRQAAGDDATLRGIVSAN